MLEQKNTEAEEKSRTSSVLCFPSKELEDKRNLYPAWFEAGCANFEHILPPVNVMHRRGLGPLLNMRIYRDRKDLWGLSQFPTICWSHGRCIYN